MADEVGRLVIVLAAGGGLLLSIIAQLVILLVLVRGWIDKANAKHYLHEHVLDKASGETVIRRLIRCDTNCPVLHPHEGEGRLPAGRYADVRGRGQR